MIIKCKMCGGDLHPEIGNTTCECEFCGTVQTIPTDDGEKKTNLFNRANRLRMNAEFDKAAAVYESITAEFPAEAEAYWGLCLCAYGIEYVDDPATGEKMPTSHRTLPTSIMEDSNFEQACDNADAIARRIYREEAKAIDRIQKDILSIVANETPYDVFICYKETTEEGGRTEDSVLAQEIYDALTGKGLKVFFSRITLEDKLGQQYEPYIYAALSSAKVMLAIGTKYEYYDAVWVKNEWARFLSMMRTEKNKALIPCYKDLDAYDIPKEFKNLQGQDMGKLGWLQDLTRGVLKLCGKSIWNTEHAELNSVTKSGPTTDTLLERAQIFLEDQKWDEANQYADKVLDIEPKNPMAYTVKLLVDLQKQRLEELKKSITGYGNNENYKKIVRFHDQYPQYDERIKLIIGINEAITKAPQVYEAIWAHNEDTITALLEEGVSPNLAFENEVYSGTILNYAVEQCDSRIVRLLLHKGADPDSERLLKNGNRFSALCDSIYPWTNDKIARMLVDAGANVNYLKTDTSLTAPIMTGAIYKGNTEMVKLLLEKGANPNAERVFKNGNRSSMLWDSLCEWPNDEIAKALIEAGANVNCIMAYEGENSPILTGAIMKKNIEMVKLLLEKGANPNAERVFKNGNRYSMLRDSIYKWPNDEIARMLIEAGANVNYAETNGDVKAPVLTSAIINGNVEMVKLLLENGANPNAERVFKNGNRYSMLWDSLCEWPNDEIARMLIEAGADVNYAETNGEVKAPVLSSAILKGNVGIVKLLLEKGANPNAERVFKNGARFNHLYDSIEYWPNKEISKLLIKAGAKGNLKIRFADARGSYTMLYALFEGSAKLSKLPLEKKLEYAEILIDAGARFDDEPDSIKRMKLNKSFVPHEIYSKMKKAGWKSSFLF